MSYEMNPQPTTYPYPPPGPAVAPPPRRQFSKWWPISFFIAAFIFIIVGGGLVGAWSANATCSRSSSYSSSSYRYYSCSNSALFYGGIACVAIGGICKLVAWILLIVFCVKRSRHQPLSGAYTYQPIDHHHAAAPPYQNATMYQNAPPYQSAPAPAAHPKEAGAMGVRYCGHCGGAVTTPFCAQCGNKA